MRVVKFKIRFNQLNEFQKIEIICQAQKYADREYWKLIEIFTIIEVENPLLYYQYLSKISFDRIFSLDAIKNLFFLNAKRLYYTAAGGHGTNVEIINNEEVLSDYKLLFDNYNQKGNYRILFTELAFVQKIIVLDSLREYVNYRDWAYFSNDNLILLFTYFNNRKELLELKSEDFSVMYTSTIKEDLNQIFWH